MNLQGLTAFVLGLIGGLMLFQFQHAYPRDTYATDPRYTPCHSPSGYCLKNEERKENPCGPQ